MAYKIRNFICLIYFKDTSLRFKDRLDCQQNCYTSFSPLENRIILKLLPRNFNGKKDKFILENYLRIYLKGFTSYRSFKRM